MSPSRPSGDSLGAQLAMSSRLRRAGGPRHPWDAGGGVTVDLPVILDFVISHRVTGEVHSVTEATIDLRGGAPALVRMCVDCPGGIDTSWIQREFRWSGPLEVVTRVVPALIRAGRDPFTAAFPTTDLPEATHPAAQRRLSREFLEDIARQYLTLGPGYAKALAMTHQVSPRTVVSWVEKARQRGILSPTSPGRHGGRIQPSAPPEAAPGQRPTEPRSADG